MKKLPKREDNDKKQAYYDYLNCWNKNHKIRYVIILVIVLLLFGALMYWVKSSGFLYY